MEKSKEKRKVIKKHNLDSSPHLGDHYESLKYNSKGEPESKGRYYSLKGVHNLVKNKDFSFIIDFEVSEDLRNYANGLKNKKENYKPKFANKKNLKSKLI